MNSEWRAHKKLEGWKESMALTTLVYQVTGDFPKSEVFGLSSQMCRAAVSIQSNIAESAARHSTKEFLQFLNKARGSLSELDTQFEIALNLGYLSPEQKDEIDKMITFISKKLAGLIQHLKVIMTSFSIFAIHRFSPFLSLFTIHKLVTHETSNQSR